MRWGDPSCGRRVYDYGGVFFGLFLACSRLLPTAESRVVLPVTDDAYVFALAKGWRPVWRVLESIPIQNIE